MTAPKLPKRSSTPQNVQPRHAWFALPEPIRRVFDHFPLTTHDPNKLPQRAPRHRTQHVLYIFASGATGELSCNPACLKWQAFLKFSGIDFTTAPSNNHASPNGSLPFLLPCTRDSARPSSPLPANKLSKWVVSQNDNEGWPSLKYEAYTSLLDHRIRNAWLYSLYLDKLNFQSVAHQLYISPASSNWIVQATLAYKLRQAARDELLKTSVIVDEEDLYNEAEKAFEALSTLLGEDETYSGECRPNLFDASVFSYTYLLQQLQWSNSRLADSVKKFPNLVRHQDYLLDFYFNA